jgi:hypothetical protein
MSPAVLLDQFPANRPLPAPWRTFLRGSGRLEAGGATLRLVTTNTLANHYSNAQIDDYQGLARRDFWWRPPLRLTVRARFSHPAGILSGTAGFGFWNDPFLMTGLRRPALPRVVWFFYSSPPSNMKLDLHCPGPGWKAGAMDATRWPFFALLPAAPLAIPLMRLEWLYHRCWPLGQRAVGVSEALLPVAMTDWHEYALDWQSRQVHFWVDGHRVLATPIAPKGPLGFVLWLDNQYMVVTPWGNFGYGLLAQPEQQWLEISSLAIITR